MVDLLVSNFNSEISIQSYKGIYKVHFVDNPFLSMEKLLNEKLCFIVDKNISRIYKEDLRAIFNKSKILEIEANEYNKDLDRFSKYAASLAEMGVKRDWVLVALGGGIIQDITCFLASTLFRGMKWYFFPTTLLAQADSCIGSKSSINVAGVKNLMGTFTPPNEIFLAVQFLKTLEFKDILSGVGEMIKVHGIAGIKALTEISNDYEGIISHPEKMKQYIYNSLMIKKRIIELDEFDTGIRNVMNYGHTFGHAIESATDYGISHGIAVTIGQDMACNYSYQKGLISKESFDLANKLLLKNFGESRNVKISSELFLSSIKKDKKNIDQQVAIIIPVNNKFEIEKKLVDADNEFIDFCQNYFLKTGFVLI